MKKIRVLALAGALAIVTARCGAVTIAENFSGDPADDGWQVSGNADQFQWDSANQDLDVTWDSSQPNSFYYYSLGTTLTRNDDFCIEFDLQLSDIASGSEPGKTGSMQLGFGFLNYTNVASANFERGAFGSAPNVAEFDYYAHGYYTDPYYDSPATTTPSFISGVDSYDYAPSDLSVYENELPTNLTVHVKFSYTASNQTAVVCLTTNGVSLGQLPLLVLNAAGFTNSDDYSVDTFCISSYSSAGDDYDSVLAHGTVGNIVITLPPVVRNMTGAFTNGVWQVQVGTYSGWFYILQRTTDFQTWTDVTAPASGDGTVLSLQDLNPPACKAFYRVEAGQNFGD